MDNVEKILTEIGEVKAEIIVMKTDMRTLTVAIGGHPNIPDDRGMAGDLEDIKIEIKQVALNKSSIERAWWWLGGISLAIIAAICAMVKSGLSKMIGG